MNKLFLTFLLFSFSFFALPGSTWSQKRSTKAKTVKVKSYTTKKGKHVNTHYRSKPGKRYSFAVPVIDVKRRVPLRHEKNVLFLV